jgi:hypothetical protein
VSPLRAEAVAARTAAVPEASGGPSTPTPQRAAGLPTIDPAEPIPTYVEPAGAALASADADSDDEPPLPDEARARVAVASESPTPQVESQPDQVLHVRFGGAAPERLILAMETIRTLLRERPGGTRVVLHVPATSGTQTLPMELSRRVAYDQELLSEVRRRLGDGLVELRLA